MEVPTGVELEVLMVNVEDPDPVMVVGLNVAVAPAGSPLAPKVTVPEKPFWAVIVVVKVVPKPAVTVWLFGLVPMEKSGCPVTPRVIFAVWVRLPLVAVMMSG